MASLGATVTVLASIMLILALTKESCPFLYTQSDSGFELERELYSGAIFKGTERTDYFKLHHLKETGDSYLLKIADEAQKTQYTDELTLLVIDHPKNMDVFIGSDDLIRTIQNLIAAISAQDLKGQNFKETALASDGWMSCLNPLANSPNNPEDLSSGIILQFPKPKEAKRAKLVVRIGNTYWADLPLKIKALAPQEAEMKIRKMLEKRFFAQIMNTTS